MTQEVEIQILLSTYNGSRYIKEQLRSLLNQNTKYCTEILIRDDGSTDNTLSLIQETLQELKSNISVQIEQGEHVGFKDSFCSLLNSSSAPLIFLCDQDDSWNEDKVEIMATKLQSKKEEVACAFSNLGIMDEKNISFLEKVGYVHSLNYEKFFFQNFIPGCSIAFTKKTRDIFIELKKGTDEKLLHDHSLILISAMADNLIYIDQKLMSYRIHENNTLGISKALPFIVKLKELLKYTFNNKQYREKIISKEKHQLLKDLDHLNRNMPFISERMNTLLNYAQSLGKMPYLKRKFYLLKYEILFRKDFMDKIIVFFCF